MDVSVSIVVLILATAVGGWIKVNDFHWVQILVTLLCLPEVFIFARLLAAGGTLWTDYWIVSLALLLHSPIQQFLDRPCLACVRWIERHMRLLFQNTRRIFVHE